MEHLEQTEEDIRSGVVFDILTVSDFLDMEHGKTSVGDWIDECQKALRTAKKAARADKLIEEIACWNAVGAIAVARLEALNTLLADVDLDQAPAVDLS